MWPMQLINSRKWKHINRTQLPLLYRSVNAKADNFLQDTLKTFFLLACGKVYYSARFIIFFLVFTLLEKNSIRNSCGMCYFRTRLLRSANCSRVGKSDTFRTRKEIYYFITVILDYSINISFFHHGLENDVIKYSYTFLSRERM